MSCPRTCWPASMPCWRVAASGTTARCSRRRISGPDGSIRSQLALNDVVLAKWETGRILDFETRIDGRFVNTPRWRRPGGGQRAPAPRPMRCPAAAPSSNPASTCWWWCPSARTRWPTAPSWSPVAAPSRCCCTSATTPGPRSPAMAWCSAELHPRDRLEIRPSAHRITLLHPPGLRLLPAAALQAPLGPRRRRAPTLRPGSFTC